MATLLKTIQAVMLALLVFSVTSTRAQEKSQQHSILDDKKKCWDQAQAYVAKKNADLGPAPVLPDYPELHKPYEFEQAHYDAKTQICYVQMSRGMSMFPPGGALEGVISEVIVADAFEGKEIAHYDQSWSTDSKTGKTTWAESTECQVNGQKCGSRPEFNSLLWESIPAFQPVRCTDENGKPCSAKKEIREHAK